ncbi:MAG: type II toxin-antitoxin system PemK/MazF family toxin [Phormidium sp.]
MMKFLPMNLQRGDVVLCRVPMPSTQLQEFKLRPAVIISADRLNQILDDVMIVACTSNTNRSLTATQYLITGDEISTAGIRVDSVVRCESIFTLNRQMIVRKLGSLSAESMDEVNNCLRVALEL